MWRKHFSDLSSLQQQNGSPLSLVVTGGSNLFPGILVLWVKFCSLFSFQSILESSPETYFFRSTLNRAMPKSDQFSTQQKHNNSSNLCRTEILLMHLSIYNRFFSQHALIAQFLLSYLSVSHWHTHPHTHIPSTVGYLYSQSSLHFSLSLCLSVCLQTRFVDCSAWTISGLSCAPWLAYNILTLRTSTFRNWYTLPWLRQCSAVTSWLLSRAGSWLLVDVGLGAWLGDWARGIGVWARVMQVD